MLPADQAAARRLTYATLPALARRTNVKFLDRRVDVEPIKDRDRLGVLKIHTQWQGDYESLRRFIYELESAPAFVIIDDVTLAQADPDEAADAVAGALDVLPPGRQWQLSAAAS